MLQPGGVDGLAGLLVKGLPQIDAANLRADMRGEGDDLDGHDASVPWGLVRVGSADGGHGSEGGLAVEGVSGRAFVVDHPLGKPLPWRHDPANQRHTVKIPAQA